MALSADNLQALTKAFSGLGVCENTLITLLGKSHPQERQLYRKESSHFSDDERLFERWDHHHAKILKHEFLRFHKAMVLWTMHPWERDARLVNKALKKGPQSYGVVVEVACARSSDELLGARRAYHSLFDRSIEEDVANHMEGPERKLLVALVSAYRYEGTKVKDDTAKSEAKALAGAIKTKAVENEDVIRILATRSKLHLKAVYKHYKDISGNLLDEDLDELRLKETVQCLCTPANYFSNARPNPQQLHIHVNYPCLFSHFSFKFLSFFQVLDSALKIGADKSAKKALTRVMVSRADVDMKEINEAYQKHHGLPLPKKIEESTNGNYKDLLLTLAARGC